MSLGFFRPKSWRKTTEDRSAHALLAEVDSASLQWLLARQQPWGCCAWKVSATQNSYPSPPPPKTIVISSALETTATKQSTSKHQSTVKQDLRRATPLSLVNSTRGGKTAVSYLAHKKQIMKKTKIVSVTFFVGGSAPRKAPIVAPIERGQIFVIRTLKMTHRKSVPPHPPGLILRPPFVSRTAGKFLTTRNNAKLIPV